MFTICVINKGYAAVPPNIRGYSWFQGDGYGYDPSLRQYTTDPAHNRSLSGHGTHSGTRSNGTNKNGGKIDSIAAKGKDCLLIGDLNRNMDKPRELTKTRLMKS